MSKDIETVLRAGREGNAAALDLLKPLVRHSLGEDGEYESIEFEDGLRFGTFITEVLVSIEPWVVADDVNTQRADELYIFTEDDQVFRMLHHQDCCESVVLEEFIGEVDDLRGAMVIKAECVTERKDYGEDDWGCDSGTYTFYKIQTTKGFVTLRWLGESNGYYSERVSFEQWAPDLRTIKAKMGDVWPEQ